MKKTLVAAFAIAAALAPFGAFAAEEITHAVSAVSVFTDRAVVTRTGTAKLEKGKNEIVFAGVPADVDLRSIRAGARVPAGVKILGVSWERRVERVAKSGKIAEAESRRRELVHRETELFAERDAQRARLDLARDARRSLLESVGEQGAARAGEDASAQPWESELAALTKLENEAREKLFETENALVAIDSEIGDAQWWVGDAFGSADAQRSVALVVTLEAERAGEAEISVAYTTRAARWKPRYSARLDRAAGTVDFSYDGEISQNTGEDWKGVALTLSTAQPQVSALPPRVRSVELYGESLADPRARRIVATEEAAPAAEPPANFADAAPADEDRALSRVREQGAVVNFELRGAHDVPSGKAAPRVSIARATLADVELRAEAAPRLRAGVYLRATAKNETPCPILPGELSLFRDGAFIGGSSLKFVPVGGEIAFFAGTEDGLSAAFEELPPFRATHGSLKASFSGKSSTDAAGDVYTLANLTGTPRKVRLRSQIKVSEVDDVKISLLETPYEHVPATTPGFTLEKDTGMIFWDVSVPARGEAKIVLSSKTEKK